MNLLRERPARTRGLTIRWHDPEASAAEGLASRGDRRMGAVIERVWRAGGTFQEWSERFDLALWEEALAAEGLSLKEVVYRDRGEHEALPWDHISAGLHRDFLWTDWQDALAEAAVEDCRWTPCYDCGACTEFGLEHVVASTVPPAGGSQGTGQDLADGGRVPVRLVGTPCGEAGARGGRGSGSPRPGRSVSPVTATWPACGSGPCAAAGCRWRSPRGSRPTPSSASDWPSPPGASRAASTSMPGWRGRHSMTSPWSATARDPRRPRSPRGWRCRPSPLVGLAEGSLQQEVASCDWELEVLGVAGEELQERVERVLAAPSLTVRRERKGRQTEDDIRPAILALALTRGTDLSRGNTRPVASGQRWPRTRVASVRATCFRRWAPIWCWRGLVGRINGSSATAHGSSRFR